MANKQFTKSNDKKLAGVCGGVAEYLGMDPTIVRVIWLLCIFLGGFGLLLYIILWLAMPAAPKASYTERMQEKLNARKQ